ncbi:hypothetical protein [Alkalihalobacillus sp. TS-13]|uniref:hypothetical protein n=1 Tax=Alkalihalobacillus sp. TS-13 TaxID=2842455 RepID=UPI001C887E61|nr:hypothetical protein [Alkalihalobacillus sp. TS-13]
MNLFKLVKNLFSSIMTVVFITPNAGELLKAKEKLESMGIIDYKVETGDKTTIHFADPVVHKIKVFNKDVPKARETLSQSK